MERESVSVFYGFEWFIYLYRSGKRRIVSLDGCELVTYRNVSTYYWYGVKLFPYGQYRKTQLFESFFNARLISLNAIDPKTKLFMSFQALVIYKLFLIAICNLQ